MKKALICPNESSYLGYRIAQVESAENIFGVADPLYWIDCTDNVIADQWYFDANENVIKEIPAPVIIPAKNQPSTSGSQSL